MQLYGPTTNDTKKLSHAWEKKVTLITAKEGTQISKWKFLEFRWHSQMMNLSGAETELNYYAFLFFILPRIIAFQFPDDAAVPQD